MQNRLLIDFPFLCRLPSGMIKFADFRLADWQNLEVCGFANVEIDQEFPDKQFANCKNVSLLAHLGYFAN
jgi:hypothetical protein